MNRMENLGQRDLAHIWHPCSQMKDYETLKPIAIDHGKGSYLYDVNGNSYLDIISVIPKLMQQSKNN